MMRRLLRRFARRLSESLGWVIINPALYNELRDTLADTKGGVSQIQQEVGDTLSHMLALRKEIAEARPRIDLAYEPPPRCTEWLVENHMLATPLVIIDVGVQGGIGPRWEHLGGCLEVHGFDALEEAIEPLAALCRPNHRYYAVALGNEDGERELLVAPEPTATSFYRHDSSRYGVDERVSHSASARRVPIRRLDALVAEGALARADFIKIDCEGFEPEILKGAQALLRSGVIALELETSFNASPALPQSHFCASCEQLLPHGLTLFDLAFDRTPRASFVARARSLGFSETVNVARPATVNALFYRDAPARSAQELLKRVAILELYGMADTAYDILIAGADLLPAEFPRQFAADLLIKQPEQGMMPPAGTVAPGSPGGIPRRLLGQSVPSLSRAITTSIQ
jgi:FkbM family methyltransferase